MSRPHRGCAYPSWGDSEHQAIARRAAGIETRRTSPKVTEKLVGAIVAVVCEHCGCTYGKPLDGKRRSCDFCGRKPGAIRVETSKWDPTAPVVGGSSDE